MEFDTHGEFNGTLLPVPVHRILPEKITVIHADTLVRIPQNHKNALEGVIDEMGRRSATAQGLGSVITTVRRMMHTDQRLYVSRTERAVTGILKVGRKKLFIRDHMSGKMNEIEPLCVLDFYVHESVQRSGLGKEMFEHMLARERTMPAMLGYDRPSPKLMGFLRKHYQLSNFDPQSNNFVVFKNYFTTKPPQHPTSAQSGRRAIEHIGLGELDTRMSTNMSTTNIGSHQDTNYERGKRNWWSDTKNDRPSDNFFLGGSAAQPRVQLAGRRSELASAPAGLQAGLQSYTDANMDASNNQLLAGNVNANSRDFDVFGHRRGEIGVGVHKGEQRRGFADLQGGEDTLSSLMGKGGGMQVARKDSSRDFGRTVQDSVGPSLQEQAAARIGALQSLQKNYGAQKNEQTYSISGGGNVSETWQRSNAQYGSHIHQQRGSSDRAFAPSERQREAVSEVNNVGGWKYNPYSQFQVDRGVQGNSAGDQRAPSNNSGLVKAALNDRRIGTRLW